MIDSSRAQLELRRQLVNALLSFCSAVLAYSVMTTLMLRCTDLSTAVECIGFLAVCMFAGENLIEHGILLLRLRQFTGDSDRARLGPLFAHLFGEMDLIANF